MRFKITYAEPGDLDLLVEHRLRMWHELRPELRRKIDLSRAHTRKWIKAKLEGGGLVGFIARTPDGRVAGSGCIWLRDDVPRPNNPRHVTPYLISMYTVKGFRMQGVAKEIVKRAVGWSREHHHERVMLDSSDDGRHLYEELGFKPTNEMRLIL